ncbi:hypothetical protein QWA68_002873 [Fusarium oxysporum]|nr:hypothetical protein QWA68_002873 [Fusarium oxysporum]
MYRLLSPKKRPDREVEACCILSKDVDTSGPKNLVRALKDYKLEQDQSFEDWVKTILMLLAPNMVESTVLIVSERGAMHVFKNNPYIIADAILDGVYQVASSPKHRLGNKVLSGIYERKESQF